VKAVDNVNFDVYRGDTFGLVGESGCGKTTVGKIMVGLLEADGGDVTFEGKPMMAKRNLAMRKNIQIVFQDPYGSLNPRMTVHELLAEPMKKHKMGNKTEINQKVLETIDIISLNKRDLYKYPHEFSGGQRQRIAIARALMLEPQLLVCDEPVSALDVSVQAQILNLFKRLQQERGISYLFIAHGLATVKHISNRVGVMYLGQMVEMAETKTMFDACVHPYTRALFSSIPVPDPTHKSNRVILHGEVPSPLNPPPGCKFHTRCIYACEHCKQDEPILREIAPGHRVACHLSEQLAR